MQRVKENIPHLGNTEFLIVNSITDTDKKKIERSKMGENKWKWVKPVKTGAHGWTLVKMGETWWKRLKMIKDGLKKSVKMGKNWLKQVKQVNTGENVWKHIWTWVKTGKIYENK